MDEARINDAAIDAAKIAGDAFKEVITGQPFTGKREPFGERKSTLMYQDEVRDLADEMDGVVMQWARQSGRDLPLGSILALIEVATDVARRHGKNTLDVGLYAKTLDAPAPAGPSAVTA